LDLNNAVNEQIPVKTAMPLEVNDQSYDVTKWVSFAGKQVILFGDIHNCIQEIINLIYISYILFYVYQLVQDKSSSLQKE
jgi:large-conductance mechanosensitive channel